MSKLSTIFKKEFQFNLSRRDVFQTTTSGTFNAIVLTGLNVDDIPGAVFSGGQLQLPKGRYLITLATTAFKTAHCKIVLRDITNGVYISEETASNVYARTDLTKYQSSTHMCCILDITDPSVVIQPYYHSQSTSLSGYSSPMVQLSVFKL